MSARHHLVGTLALAGVIPEDDLPTAVDALTRVEYDHVIAMAEWLGFVVEQETVGAFSRAFVYDAKTWDIVFAVSTVRPSKPVEVLASRRAPASSCAPLSGRDLGDEADVVLLDEYRQGRSGDVLTPGAA